MKSAAVRPSSGWWGILLGIAALACLLAPERVSLRMSRFVCDALAPGHAVVQSTQIMLVGQWNRWSHSFQPVDESGELRKQLRRERQRARQLEIAQAQLHQELDLVRRQGNEVFVGESSRPLVVPELLEARVVGREQGQQSIADLLLNMGSEQGAIESAMVLESEFPLIDQGEQDSVAVGQPVYAGSAIVGRIARTGRWVSSVQFITDPQYRGRARILRKVGSRYVFGAEGRIAGIGQGFCRLEEIPATEGVTVGDRVYSGTRTAAVNAPLFYGTIVRAELEAGAEEWSIDVEPAASLESVRRVTVLRESLNPARLLAN